MADYKDLNLNLFLQPLNSPVTSGQFTSSYQFQNEVERGAVTTGLVRNIRADQITAGTINVSVEVGASNVKIDGANARMVINDGTTDRIYIGYQEGGF
jgi:hypothetical protein